MKRTPLYESHVALGAHMVGFAGYEMPVRYKSEKAEHQAVREAAGLFDVSHMGEVFLTGPKACEAADRLLTNDLAKAGPGQAVYALMLNDTGGAVDDVVAYKYSDEKVLLCVNASNREKDFGWIKTVLARHYTDQDVVAKDLSDDFAQVALQGPNAEKILSTLATFALARFHFCETTLEAGGQQIPAIIARTGYTGEDGFEIFVPTAFAVALWSQLLKAGAAPCGLSARDTLRLEAGMCLYGNDLDDTTSPLEAGLSWVVKWEKAVPFEGRAALLVQKEQGIKRRLVGLKLEDRNIARAGFEVVSESGEVIGRVSSGTLSPTLGIPVAMAFIQKPFAEAGTTVYVKIRQTTAKAVVTKLPFYKKA